MACALRDTGHGGLAAVFAAATSAWAQATVQTLGGGHADFYGQPNGWVDGNTLEDAMFNSPMGPVIGADGNLWLADHDNGAIRKLLLSTAQTRTVLTNLNRPVGIVFDRDNYFYVVTAGDGAVRKYDTNLNVLATLTTGLTAPTAVAIDGSKNLYVSQANGVVVRVHPTTGVITTIGTGLNNPGGLTVTLNGFIAVSDSGNHAVKVFDPSVAPSTGTILVGTNGAGLVNGPASLAKLNTPWGIAQGANGQFVVADRGNHLYRLIQTNGYVSTLCGVPTNNWVASIGAGAGMGYGGLNVWPGWADGPYDPTDPLLLYPASMDPVSLLLTSGSDLYVTEWGYHIVRKITGVDFSAAGTGTGGSTNGIVVAPPTIDPGSSVAGYYPNGQTIYIHSANPDVFYTTDGTEPTTNSTRVTMNGNAGSLWWNGTTNDLSQLRLKAFVGTNVSATVSGQAIAISTIGVPAGVHGNYYAAPGSTLYMPVVVNLVPNAQVKSLLYYVDITASASAPSVSSAFTLISSTTNDFVPMVGLAKATLNFTDFGDIPGTPGGTRSLLVQCIGTNFGEAFTSYGVVSMLAVPIPATAPANSTYTISVPMAAATADGNQTDIPIVPAGSATIVVGASNSSIAVTTGSLGPLAGVLPAGSVGYLVGDSSAGIPGSWYNAGEFGDGNLTAADVNNALNASLGFRVPPTASDVYDAMDAFPLDTVGAWGGDGEIRFLDVQTIIYRTMHLDTNNYVRIRMPNGTKTVLGPVGHAHSLESATSQELLPGAVWVRQARLFAGIITNAQPGQSVSVPVTLNLNPSNGVTGLSFSAAVRPLGGVGPAVTDAAFVPAAGRPASSIPAGVTIPAGMVACNWDNLGTRLMGDGNLLGYITFTVPAEARAGQCYVVRFVAGSGGDVPNPRQPSTWQEPKFEIVAGKVFVRCAAPAEPVTLPDNWCTRFFGSADNPAAAVDADPDKDGVPNWKEYLAGTNPTQADSALKLRPRHAAGTLVLNWLSAPGKTYVIEYTSTLTGGEWTEFQTVVGDGNYQEVSVPSNPMQPRFYRIRLVQ